MSGIENSTVKGPLWYIPEEEMKQTPSIRRGMSEEEEMDRRRRGIRFIKHMVGYLGLEIVSQSQSRTLKQTKTPKLFPTAVHMFHRFYTIHPFQLFNEYVTAVSCLFHASKIEEKVILLDRILWLARHNATGLGWVELPKQLSFSRNDWASVWKNEVIETEEVLFATVSPLRYKIYNVYVYIIVYLNKLVGDDLTEAEAVKVCDKAFSTASDVYGCGSSVIVTEPCATVAAMCLMTVLKLRNIKIRNWSGKQENQPNWFNVFNLALTIDHLERTEKNFLAHLKQYNIAKKMQYDKLKVPSPTSDYGSEGSSSSRNVSPRELAASSSNQGLSISLNGISVSLKKIDSAPICQVPLSMKRGLSPSSSNSPTSFTRQRNKSEEGEAAPASKKARISPIRWP